MKKTYSQQATYWLGVVAVGLVVGLSVQFASAWTNPTATPPNSNVPGPLTTGDTGQSKTGNLALNTVGAYATGLTVNRDLQMINGKIIASQGLGQGICFGTDCRTSWNDAVVAGSSVVYAAGSWFNITCDKNGHVSPFANCPDGTRPVSCLYDLKTNGQVENGTEYYQLLHDNHSGATGGAYFDTFLNVFTMDIVPAGQKGLGSQVSTNGACNMWYQCDANDLYNGAEIRMRAVCVPAGTGTILNPNQSGGGSLVY